MGAEIAGRPLPGDVVVVAVADEEAASVGTEGVLERVSTDGAVVAEPTELRVAIAHKGFVTLEVETHGRAAHGSTDGSGICPSVARSGTRSVMRQRPF